MPSWPRTPLPAEVVELRAENAALWPRATSSSTFRRARAGAGPISAWVPIWGSQPELRAALKTGAGHWMRPRSSYWPTRAVVRLFLLAVFCGTVSRASGRMPLVHWITCALLRRA
ncbi:hypothetical protein ACFQYP_56875 [Nonomuraea antimicrobica]